MSLSTASAVSGLRAHVLMYHAFYPDGAAATGTPGERLYSLSLAEFRLHLTTIKERLDAAPSTYWDFRGAARRSPCWALTFDDGLASAPAAAEIVESLGWHGHFFITTDAIGTPGFMGRDEIRELHSRGHIIGSHSVSHPDPMSELPYSKLVDEWRCSAEELGELLGEPVRVASLPGGGLSARVVAAAAEAGLEVLFTSEPTGRIDYRLGCLLVGRYSVKNRCRARTAASLAAGNPLARGSQRAAWYTRKIAKRVLGKSYYSIRMRILRS